MSSLQSLREFISERLAAAAEEIFRHCEGTIVQYEEELCRQRRLLDIIWKPQLQLHQIVFPQHWVTEEEDRCHQQRNFRVEQEDPELPQIEEQQKEQEPQQIKKEEKELDPTEIKEEQKEPEPTQIKEEEKELDPTEIKEEQKEPEPTQIKEEEKELDPTEIKEEQKEPEPTQIKEEEKELDPTEIKEEQKEPEPTQIKEEQEELCISQDEKQLDLKQETDTLIAIPTYEVNEHSDTELYKQRSFNATDGQDEKGNQHEESTPTEDGETDPQNRDQKRKDRSHVQNVDSSHMSESQSGSDVTKKFKKASMVQECQLSTEERRVSPARSAESSITVSSNVDKENTESDGNLFVCKECNQSFVYWSLFRIHMRDHTGDKLFSCKLCKISFSCISHLKCHSRTHIEGRFFSCEECYSRFNRTCNLKKHMRIHTGENLYACKECDKRFNHMSHLKLHMITHR